MTKVSIIIPCYNLGKYVMEAINSALASTYKNIEIIVVNDGSTEEETLKVLDNIQITGVKVVHQENKGPASAKNTGIKHSCGSYVLPLDADDKIHPTYIEKAVGIIEKNLNIGIVYCKVEFFGTKSGVWNLKKYTKENLLTNNMIVNCALFKKSDWVKAGGYKEDLKNIFDDWEFWISLIELGAEVYQIPEILFYYRQGANFQSSKVNKKTRMECYKKILKWHPKIYADNYENLPKFFNYISQSFNKSVFKMKLNKKWNLKISLEPRES